MTDLEIRLGIATMMARRLWATLKARSGLELDALFGGDRAVTRVLDKTYDAAETLFERHRVVVEPCRRILDDPPGGVSWSSGPGQPEMYVGRWPDGSTRNLTRAELLMMGGQDPDEPAEEEASSW